MAQNYAEDDGEEEEEEDYGKLIYNEYQLRRKIAAEAAAAAARTKRNEKTSTASTRVRKSTRKRSRVKPKEQRPDSQQKRSAKRKRESSLETSKGRRKEVTKKKMYRYECSAEGCTNHVVKGGVCNKHGAKVKVKFCSSDGCTNKAYSGGVCNRHGATKKLCSTEGCTNEAKRGGVCMRHGAKVKKKRYIKYECSADGCTNNAYKGGVCVRHGAKLKLCSDRSQRSSSSSSWSTGTDVEQQSPEHERRLCGNFDWDTGLLNLPTVKKTSLAPSSYEDQTAFNAGYSFVDEPSNNIMPFLPFLCRTTADDTKDIASALLDLDANPLQTCVTCVKSSSSNSESEVFVASPSDDIVALTSTSNDGVVNKTYDPSVLERSIVFSQDQQQQQQLIHHDHQLNVSTDSSGFDTGHLHCGTNNSAFATYKSLSIPIDENFLEPVYNFLRSKCIEVFISDNVERKHGPKPQQVGFRCVFCKHVPKRERAHQSVSYPSKAINIYEALRNYQRSHLEACAHIPNEIKEEYRQLASLKCKKIAQKYVKAYIAEAAFEIGIVQTPHDGLAFGGTPNTSGKPSEKLLTIMKIAQNPLAHKHLEDAIFPKVDDRIKRLKFSHIASENTVRVINNCRRQEAAFVEASDYPTLSDFCFVLYHQFVACRPPVSALKRRKTKPQKWDSLSGFCCKFCAQGQPAESNHKGMYFPLEIGALQDSSSSFSHNVTAHAMTCPHVPLHIREALEELQLLAGEYGVTTKRGTKKLFMEKLWDRLSNYYARS